MANKNSSSKTSSNATASSAAIRPKDIGGKNFQSLVAGWEHNTGIGKGVTATTVATFPAKSNITKLSPVPKTTATAAASALATTITINSASTSLSENTNSQPQQPQAQQPQICSLAPPTWTTPSPSSSATSTSDVLIRRPNSIFDSHSLYSSSTSNLHNLLSSPTTGSSSMRNAAMREQFMLGYSGDGGSSTSLANTFSTSPATPSRQFATSAHQQQQQSQHAVSPVTPSYGGRGYRFAGLERLAHRGNIYSDNNVGATASYNLRSQSKDSGSFEHSSIDSPKNEKLNSKREYYFRDSASPTSGLTNGTKDYAGTRDRIESSLMGFSSRNGDDAATSSSKTPQSGLSKEGETGFVGFSYLPNQIHRKTVKKGFEFTLMVVGESGLGKSTLVNSMFLTDIYSAEYPGPSKRASKTVEVETTRVLLKEKSVNLNLTVVDTPGYGTAVDNTNCWQPIVNFIENRYEEYLNAETRVHRTHIQDNRVHCCLYFIAPSGHSLKPIDIEFMLHLHDKVNIIPVIAKSDTLTPEEITAFKKSIMNEINQQKIKIYDFPDCEDEEDVKLLKSMKGRVPFAVVGSNYVFEVNGERKRSRKYPWGLVEIENLEHCDFQALRNLLIRHYMLDLLETTNNVHYENYRCRKLTGISPDMAKKGKDNNKNPLAQMEEEKKEHDFKMKKMEVEMEQVFEQKVKEKLNKLKESEEEYLRRHDEMTKKLEQQRLELDEKRSAFEKEKAAFELVSKDMEEIRRVNTLDVNMRENSSSSNGSYATSTPNLLNGSGGRHSKLFGKKNFSFNPLKF